MLDKYTYSEGQVTAVYQEGNYLWIAFLGESNAILDKVSVFNPSDRFFRLNISATQINKIVGDSTYLYLAVDSPTYSWIKISKGNPLSTYWNVTKQVGVIENIVDLVLSGTTLYLLTPGIGSGISTSILKYNASTRAYITQFVLDWSGQQITNMKKIDIDNTNYLWIVDDTTTPVLARIDSTTGAYNKWTIS